MTTCLSLVLVLLSCSCGNAVVNRQHGARAAPESNLTHMLANRTAYAAIRQELEYELRMTEVVDVDKTVYVALCMLLGLFGCDRCFMGQVCFGIVKGITGGGLFVWAVVDYIVCVGNALQRKSEIHSVGYHVAFKPGTVQPAFYMATAILVVQWGMLIIYGLLRILGVCCRVKSAEKMATSLVRMGSSVSQITVTAMPAPIKKALRKRFRLGVSPTQEDMVDLFESIDQNSDGKIDKDELKRALENSDVADEVIDNFMKEAAGKGEDGKLTQQEFLTSFFPQGFAPDQASSRVDGRAHTAPQ